MFPAEYLAQVAEKAIVELDKRGHCRETLADDMGRVCAIGAIRLADHGSFHARTREAEYAISRSVGLLDEHYLAYFNDAPYVTKNGKRRYHDKRDVQRLLKRAARELRKQAAADGSAVSTA